MQRITQLSPSTERNSTSRENTSDIDRHQHYFGSQSRNLSSIIRGIKCQLTSFALKNHIPFQWQTRFHEHIVKSEQVFSHIYDYIQNNAINWKTYSFHPQVPNNLS